CDLVVAAEDAFFIEPFASLGLVPDTAGTFFLPRLIGLQRAAAMMMLGEKISAAQAKDWGLVYRVFPSGSLHREALAIAERLAALPPSGLALLKRALDETWRHSPAEQLALEAELQGIAGNSDESRAAIRAFLARRELKKKA
ncbi:MAG: enoyl-CoA hydratase/isomerase family protein, partial [Acidobacteriota bacterium]|nr:enoyl-CoA hydratase/isomerase family protein [Acidobacteriota bacterium]